MEAGSAIADKTAKALEEITTAVSECESIIANIADASNYQATAIAQVNTAIEQVSQVIQNNSATSEECAAASIELSNQAARMRELLTIYTLDNGEPVPDQRYMVETPKFEYAEPAIDNTPVISLGGDFGKY